MREDAPRDDLVGKRLEDLERSVEELREGLAGVVEVLRRERGAAPPPGIAPAPGPSAAAGTPAQERRPAASASRLPALLEGGDPWRWIGIALLLLGVAFLFKYSIDQGWLTPSIRVAAGLSLGAALLFLSERLPPSRRAFGRILDGGAVATLYITGFAAFQRYALVPHPVAFAFLVCVTLLAFWLAFRQDDAVLAIIGVSGGLGTPFLLQQDEGSIPGLVAYTCVVLGFGGAVYLRRGWRMLLGVAAVGGWLVLGLAVAQGASFDLRPAADRSALQAGLLAAALLFTGLPMLRALRGDAGSIAEGTLLAVPTPLVTLALSSTLWPWARETWGWIALGAAGLEAGVALLLLRAAAGREIARAQALAAAVLLTLSLALLLEGSWLVASLAAEALALRALAERDRSALAERDRSALPSALAHGLAAAVACLVAARLADGAGPLRALASPQALSDLFALGAGAQLSRQLPKGSARSLYRAAALAGLLAYFVRGLSEAANGQGLVTAAWAVTGVALLVAGLRRDDAGLRTGGRLVLFLVVGKLFLVDLSEVGALFRIVSFLGLGAVFLGLSYWLRDLWRPAAPAPEAPP